MSIASPFDTSTPPAVDATALRRMALRPIEVAAFWAAVALPLAYPALLVGGLDGRQLFLLVAAFALHAVSLLLGRDHKRDRA